MRTNFSPLQLADPHLADVEKNLRACVHCGICTATCPTYVVTGDERDGPRGRIVMMQHMLEEGGAPSPQTVHHIGRCLSCLGCRTACPSGVDYARLVDTARAHIETHYRRPAGERLMRWTIANVLTKPVLTRIGVTLAQVFAPIVRQLPGQVGIMARAALKATRPSNQPKSEELPAATNCRIALMPGCVQQALAPQIDAAAVRMLARREIGAKPLAGAGCCGALAHHLGRKDDALTLARRNVEAFDAAEKEGNVETVLMTASGCVAHLADYPHLFAGDPVWKARAEAFSAKVRDFTELAQPGRATAPANLRVAYHPPCSLQHGMRQSGKGEALLKAAGFELRSFPESHLCCGSAGSYSILQPELAGTLRARKLANIKLASPDAIASGNIGCLHHLSGPDAPPVIHLAELIDWAEGGPKPAALT